MNASQQFPRIERLGQVIVCAHLQPDNPINLVTFGCQHDDRSRVALTSQASANAQTIFARHHEIEHDQVIMFPTPGFVHLLGVRHSLDFETLFAEIAGQQVAQTGVVIDDQDVLMFIVHGMKNNCLRPSAEGKW